MTLLYLDDAMANHRTGSHPECPDRILRVNSMLRSGGWTDSLACPSWKPLSPGQMAALHTTDYIQQLRQWSDSGAGRVEEDTVVDHGSWDAAAMAAGAACDAVEKVLGGLDSRAFCAIRPPGHHALLHAPMGFCLLNNVALAAKTAIATGKAEKVLIVDFDVHHGNGTQDAFWEDPQVGFFSIHRFPFYPGTGKADETGQGAGAGTTCNVPVAGGVLYSQFEFQLKSQLEAFATKIRPDLLLISAGFDAHPVDPVGGLCVDEEKFADLTAWLVDLAIEHCQGRVVSLLEGGYHLEYMPKSVEAHVRSLSQHRTE